MPHNSAFYLLAVSSNRWKCLWLGVGGGGFESTWQSNHWSIGIDQQSYQLMQIYDGHFVQQGGKNNRTDCSFIPGSVYSYLCIDASSASTRCCSPAAVKILDSCCLAQLWLSQWKIDEALQVDTKLSVLFINVLWLDPLAALCKLIAV